MRVGSGMVTVLGTWIALFSCSEKTLEEKMAVRVNGVGIPEKRVSMIFDAYMARLPRSMLFTRIPDEVKAALRGQITEELIDQELLYLEARKRNTTVPDSLVHANMHKTEAFYRREGRFEEQLDELGITRENVEDDHRKALIVEKYLDGQIGEMPVSDRDVEEYYQANQSQFIWQDAIHSRHILIRVPSGASLEERIEAFEEAKQILQRLKAGEDFAALARAYSQDDQSASHGGDLGFIEKGRLAPEYEKAAANLQEGEISDVVKTSFGYHIIQLLGYRKGGNVKTLDEVRSLAKAMVTRNRRQQQVEKIVEELRRHATLRYAASQEA